MTFNIFMYTIYSKLEMIYVLKKYLLNYRKKLKDAVNDLKHLKTFYKQIPNILTSTRILSPFIIIPLAMTGNIVGTVITASIIASTDFFDGLIARKLNITSELGRELDAVSDKFFASALIIPLILQSPIFLANIFFEGMIATTNLKAKIKGLEPKTIFIGKVKTFSLSISLILGYLNLFIPLDSSLVIGSIISTITLECITTASYIIINSNKEIEIKDKEEYRLISDVLNNNLDKNNKTKSKDNVIDKGNGFYNTFENNKVNKAENTYKKLVLKKDIKKPRV